MAEQNKEQKTGQTDTQTPVNLYRVTAGEMANNAYILYADDRQDCVIVDTAGNGKEIIAALEQLERIPVALLLTHGHFDHISGVKALRNEFGVPVAIHKEDADMLTNPALNLGGITLEAAEVLLEGGQSIEIAGMTIEVIHTPGHTPGSVCFVCGDAMLSGDTLFRLSAGRSDFPGGNTDALINSISWLFALEGDYAVFPGHNDHTTLEVERCNNVFMKHYAPHLLRGGVGKACDCGHDHAHGGDCDGCH